jgi:hypothetical protein
VGFHVVLAPAYGLALSILALELFLAFSYRRAYASLFHARNEPASRSRKLTSISDMEANAA